MRALVLSWGIGDEQPSAPDSEQETPVRRTASTRRVASMLRERWSRGASPLRAPSILKQAVRGCEPALPRATVASADPLFQHDALAGRLGAEEDRRAVAANSNEEPTQ